MSKRPGYGNAKPDILTTALRRAFEDYYGPNGERLPRPAAESVVSDEVAVEQPTSDKTSDD